MKYYNITVNGVAYSVSVEETTAGAAPAAAPRRSSCPCRSGSQGRSSRPRCRTGPRGSQGARPALWLSRPPCPATSWM